MSEINDLRERVEAAEERFGLIDEQQRHYSDRVIGLIEAIETQLAAARSEIENQIDENLRLSQDNEELRGMLHTVLRSIEEKTFTRTLQNLEARVCALVSDARTPAAGSAEGADPAPAAAEPAMATAEAETEAEPEIDAMVDPADDTAAKAEAEVFLETAPEEVAQDSPEGCPQVPEAAMPEVSADELMTQAKQAAAMAAPAEPEQEFAEEAAEAFIEVPGSTAFEPDPAAEAIAAESVESPIEQRLPEENPEAPAEEMSEAAFEIAPAAEEASGEEASDEAVDITAPEEAMSDVTFEDDPAAVAENDQGGVAAEPDFAADAVVQPEISEPEAAEAAVPKVSEPEQAVAQEAAPETAAEPSFESAFDQLAETATAAGEAEAGGSGESAPSVKEIIRRVGDLARELEKAEAQRRAQASAEDAAPEDAAEASAAEELAAPQNPDFEQAANA